MAVGPYHSLAERDADGSATGPLLASLRFPCGLFWALIVFGTFGLAATTGLHRTIDDPGVRLRPGGVEEAEAPRDPPGVVLVVIAGMAKGGALAGREPSFLYSESERQAPTGDLYATAQESHLARDVVLAFVRNRNVFVYDPSTKRVDRVPNTGDAHPPQPGLGGDLAIAPDGKRIAYTATAPEGTDVHVVNVDGSGKRNVTPFPTPFAPVKGAHWHFDPRWLGPNRLSYLDQTGGSGGLFELRSVSLRTEARGRPLGEGTYSSQVFIVAGRRVYALSVTYPRGPRCANTTDLWLERGPRRVRLSNTLERSEGPLDYQDGAPVLAVTVWISSGKHIGGCATGRVTYRAELRAYIVGSPSRLLVPLGTFRDRSVVDAAWSPDGDSIAYIAGGRGRLTVLDLGTGKRTVIATGVTALDW